MSVQARRTGVGFCLTAGTAAMVAMVALLLSCAPASEEPPAPEPESELYQAPAVPPAVSINEVMVAVIDHASHVLWDVGREGMAPETDRDWLEIEHHAIQLTAAGTWITVGGTGEADPGWVRQLPWQQWAREMTDAGTDALAAARAKDLEALLGLGDRLIETCEACHQEYKPELPSEGYLHPH